MDQDGVSKLMLLLFVPKPEEIERLWSAFILYCVTKLSKARSKQEKEENSVSLCQILRAFKLKLAFFFFLNILVAPFLGFV